MALIENPAAHTHGGPPVGWVIRRIEGATGNSCNAVQGVVLLTAGLCARTPIVREMPDKRVGAGSMMGKQSIIFAFVLATMGYCVAWAQTAERQIDTTSDQAARWTVYEVSHGEVKSAPAVYNGTNTWGFIPNITIPFTDCNGYWYAKRFFHIPISATNLVFTITGLGVDDRAIVVLNNVRITSKATTNNGEGEMQVRDPGTSKPYNFQFIAGNVSFTDKVDLRPGGNELMLIVNNTNQGIYGKIQDIGPSSPSSVGIAATVTYTP